MSNLGIGNPQSTEWIQPMEPLDPVNGCGALMALGDGGWNSD